MPTTIYATQEEQQANQTNQTNTSLDRQTEVQSPILLQNKILNAAIDAKTVSLPTNSNNLFDQLTKKGKWKQNFFVKTIRLQKH